MPDKKSKKKRSTLDKLLLGAVIGAAVGSVVGAAVSNTTDNKKNDMANQFDKKPDVGEDKAKSWLRRLRIYLRKRNERKRLLQESRKRR